MSVVSETIHYLGKVFFKLGRYADAEANFKKALNLREESLSKTHPGNQLPYFM